MTGRFEETSNIKKKTLEGKNSVPTPLVMKVQLINYEESLCDLIK